jgi:O-antigen/teichoic acid export membrane protein
MTVDNNDIDFSLSEEETLKLQRVASVSQLEIPKRVTGATQFNTLMRPRKPKKMLLERLTLTGTTSAVLQAIKSVSEYPPEHFVQAYNRQPLTPPVISEPLVPQPETSRTSEPKAETSRPGMRQQISLKNFYKHVMTDPLYRNSIFNMSSTFMLGGSGFVFWIIIARLYKPESVGIATTLISIMTLLNNFTILGLHSSLNRYLPKSTNKNDLISSSFVIVTLVTLLTSVVFLVGIQTFSPQLSFLQSNFLYIASFTIFIIFNSWNMLVDSVFLAFRSASNIFIKNSVVSISKIILPFAFIALGAYGIFASTALAFTLGVIISLITLFVSFKVRFSGSINISIIKETMVYSFANYVTSFVINMPSLVLPVIILNALSAKYAAYYYVASMIQSILQVIPVAAGQALVTEGSYNETELKKHVKKAFTTILVILIPAISIIVFFGQILLQMFGKSYATESLQFLQLYGASKIFTAILLISNAIMNIKHQVKLLVLWNVISALLTLWLSYAFISSKLVGVGWGWMLGQAITGVISLFFIARNYWEFPRRLNTVEMRASSIRVGEVEQR